MDPQQHELPTPVDMSKVETNQSLDSVKPATSENLNHASDEKTQAMSVEHGVAMGPPAGGTIPVPAAPNPANDHPTNGTTAALGTLSLPPVADDADLIEKEWVEKAKQIVANTKDDPYNQNKAMIKVKADYLKKRFNRDMKVTDD